jgi:hypothetical protein
MLIWPCAIYAAADEQCRSSHFAANVVLASEKVRLVIRDLLASRHLSTLKQDAPVRCRMSAQIARGDLVPRQHQ